MLRLPAVRKALAGVSQTTKGCGKLLCYIDLLYGKISLCLMQFSLMIHEYCIKDLETDDGSSVAIFIFKALSNSTVWIVKSLWSTNHCTFEVAFKGKTNPRDEFCYGHFEEIIFYKAVLKSSWRSYFKSKSKPHKWSLYLVLIMLCLVTVFLKIYENGVWEKCNT